MNRPFAQFQTLESRNLFAAALGVTFDLSKFDATAVVGEKYTSVLRVTLTNTGDAAFEKTAPRINVSIDPTLGTPGDIEHPEVRDITKFKVAGLKAGKSKTFNLKVIIAPDAQAGSYSVNTAVTGQANASLPFVVTTPETSPTLVVAQPPTASNAVLVTAMTLSTTNPNQATITLKNNGKKTLDGSTSVAIYAAVPNARDLTAIGAAGATTNVGILASTTVSVPASKVKKGQTFTATVTLPSVTDAPITYEYFAVAAVNANYQPQLSDAPALATVPVSDSVVATTPVASDDVLRTAVFTSTPGPASYRVLGTVRPTLAVMTEYGVFVDANGRQGMYVFTSAISTDPVSTLGNVSVRYATAT